MNLPGPSGGGVRMRRERTGATHGDLLSCGGGGTRSTRGTHPGGTHPGGPGDTVDDTGGTL